MDQHIPITPPPSYDEINPMASQTVQPVTSQPRSCTVNINNSARIGLKCPKCSRVNAMNPNQGQCRYCGYKVKKESCWYVFRVNYKTPKIFNIFFVA